MTPEPTEIEKLKPGDEFLVAGTVDEVRDGSVIVVLDGAPVGREATLKAGTCVLKTGVVSPNYQHREVPRGT